MSTSPRTLAFRPIADRKFYLSEITIKRLGGPQAAEVMRLMVEEAASDADIKQKLTLTTAEFETITLAHFFKRTLNEQIKLRQRDAAYKESQNPTPPKTRDQFPTSANAAKGFKPSPPVIKLPAGQSAPEYAQRRINEATPEAVEKLIWMMRYANAEQTQYNSAVKLLGLNGIVEVEKSISVIADAEAIIRELNKRGPYQPRLPKGEALEAEVITETPEADRQELGDSSSGPQSEQP